MYIFRSSSFLLQNQILADESLYPYQSIYITVQSGLFLQCRKGWKITAVSHFEQLPFSPSSPTPVSKGSFSVNEGEEFAC